MLKNNDDKGVPVVGVCSLSTFSFMRRQVRSTQAGVHPADNCSIYISTAIFTTAPLCCGVHYHMTLCVSMPVLYSYTTFDTIVYSLVYTKSTTTTTTDLIRAGADVRMLFYSVF